jgi:sporulation-control protein spo0M
VAQQRAWPARRGDAPILESFTAPTPIEAGQTLSFPFRFSIPSSGPISYAGTLMQLIWELYGEVDLPWAINERKLLEIKVVPRSLQAKELNK